MDVGDPSNMERLLNLWGDAAEIGRRLRAFSVSDETIAQQIAAEHARSGFAWCPHTATAFNVYRTLADEERSESHFIIIATAHAAKFESIVEPLIGEAIEPPDELARLQKWPARFETIDAVTDEITSRLS
jgi:threonine synthase